MVKSGYPRWAREAREWRIWIWRGRCGSCRRSHGLLPSFLLERRLDVVEVIGEGVRRSVAGEGLPKIAAELGRPYSTVRDWRRRHRERAVELVAELAGRVVELGGEVPRLSGEAERWALALPAVARSAAARRLRGELVLPTRDLAHQPTPLMARARRAADGSSASPWRGRSGDRHLARSATQ